MALRSSRAAGLIVIAIALTACGSGKSDGAKAPATSRASTASNGVTSTASASTSAAPLASSGAASSNAAKSSAAKSSAAKSSATPSPTQSAATLSAAAITAKLNKSLTAVFGPDGSFSVAALDLTTGRTVSAGATSGMSEASVVKLDILETMLYQDQQNGDEPGSDDDAIAMIEHSDNSAADDVYHHIGENTGLAAYNKVVGLTHTELDPNGQWGLSTSSAADQLTLMTALTKLPSPLTQASRGYALGLMGSVEVDQTWGVSAAADAGAKTQLKNGWLNISDDDNLWAVNTVGVTTVHGHKVLLAIMSQHQPDFATGVARVKTGAVQLAAGLFS